MTKISKSSKTFLKKGYSKSDTKKAEKIIFKITKVKKKKLNWKDTGKTYKGKKIYTP
jgi:hypothetical protein